MKRILFDLRPRVAFSSFLPHFLAAVERTRAGYFSSFGLHLAASRRCGKVPYNHDHSCRSHSSTTVRRNSGVLMSSLEPTGTLTEPASPAQP
eukprot:6199496-Pleurochrysis_carterae.AAC.1